MRDLNRWIERGLCKVIVWNFRRGQHETARRQAELLANDLRGATDEYGIQIRRDVGVFLEEYGSTFEGASVARMKARYG